MRDIEFLPAWYHHLRQRKRIVALQAWVLILVIAALGTWVARAHHNVRTADTTLSLLDQQLTQTYAEQRLLADQLRLRQELKDREQIIGSLGYPVEMTRLLQTLDAVMPKEMSLVEFDCKTDETVRAVTSIAGVRAGASPERLIDRRLRVRLQGVTPSDVDLASFLAGLTNVPFLDQVAVTYARDKVDSGHLMREFEITFSMNLNQQMGS